MASRSGRERLRQEILHFLKDHQDQTYRPKQLAKQLNITDDQRFDLFRQVLKDMRKEGQVASKKGGKVAFLPPEFDAVGTLRVNPQGYGFVSVEDREEDLYVHSSKMGAAIDGDTVHIEISAPRKKDHSQEAEVLEVVERGRTQTAGTFKQKGHFAFVESDDQRLTHDIYVPQEAFNGAQEGDKVVVSIDRFEEAKASPEGRILKVIGPADAPGTDVLSLAISQGTSIDFPEPVLEEAEEIDVAIPESEIERRKDLRDKRIFTIDPVDAEDFDDAIHIEPVPGGNLEVGVHIADVSHYVEEGSELDEEALERGNSTYLVDRVIPMLPEKLSNKVCSLRPREEKLAFSCIMKVGPEGNVLDYEIAETVIDSKERFTYEEAQAVIDGEKDHELALDVKRANGLAKSLTRKRYREGSVDFDTPEVRVVLDDENHPVDIIRKERKPSNRLIEELMLLANRTVAKHIAKDEQGAQPFIYRIHDRPDAERIQNLANYVKAFGYELPLKGGNVRSKDLNDFLQRIKGTPEAPVIEQAALRSMAKAEYSTENIGHYGLGFRYYSHFTSPIRRYPDLIVHRLLKYYGAGHTGWDSRQLAQQCEHCSERERAAEEAERESVRMKKVEYMVDHVGETFEGVVSGVTNFGVFVEISELLVEGLIHVRNMNDDYYEYDEESYQMVGAESERRIRVGDSVKVRVEEVDVEARQVDLQFVRS